MNLLVSYHHVVVKKHSIPCLRAKEDDKPVCPRVGQPRNCVTLQTGQRPSFFIQKSPVLVLPRRRLVPGSRKALS